MINRSIGVGVLISGLVVSAGCSNSKTQTDGSAKPAVTVRVQTPQPFGETPHSELLGNVVARQRADIQTKVQARVERIPVRLGDRVRAGVLLIEFDTREASARVQQAKALLEQAAGDLARFETLLAKGAATQQEFDGIKARKTVAEAGLQEAEAMLSYARITAPFAGTVTRKDINEGDLAVPGRPLLTIEDESSLQLIVSIPESNRQSVHIGDTLTALHSTGGAGIAAVVEELSPSADPMTRTHTAKLALPGDDRLHAGQLLRLRVRSGGESSVSVTENSIVRRGQLELVYVIGDDSRAGLRIVRTGRRNDGRIEILAGLDGTERVVTDPPVDLEDRDPVEVAP